MTLVQQLQDLVKDAPQDGKTPQAVQAIVPVLEQVAKQLQYTIYYVWQTLDQEWAVTTLSDRAQPQREKNTIYAFSSLEDATAIGYGTQVGVQLVAMPVPVIQLLFQTLTLNSVNSLVFFDTPENLELGTEIQCQDVRNLLQVRLQQTLCQGVPPNIA